MTHLFKYIRPFINDEEGQGAVEYALILVLIALAIGASSTGVATAIKGVFTDIAGMLNTRVT